MEFLIRTFPFNKTSLYDGKTIKYIQLDCLGEGAYQDIFSFTPFKNDSKIAFVYRNFYVYIYDLYLEKTIFAIDCRENYSSHVQICNDNKRIGISDSDNGMSYYNIDEFEISDKEEWPILTLQDHDDSQYLSPDFLYKVYLGYDSLRVEYDKKVVLCINEDVFEHAWPAFSDCMNFFAYSTSKRLNVYKILPTGFIFFKSFELPGRMLKICFDPFKPLLFVRCTDEVNEFMIGMVYFLTHDSFKIKYGTDGFLHSKIHGTCFNRNGNIFKLNERDEEVKLFSVSIWPETDEYCFVTIPSKGIHTKPALR